MDGMMVFILLGIPLLVLAVIFIAEYFLTKRD